MRSKKNLSLTRGLNRIESTQQGVAECLAPGTPKWLCLGERRRGEDVAAFILALQIPRKLLDFTDFSDAFPLFFAVFFFAAFRLVDILVFFCDELSTPSAFASFPRLSLSRAPVFEWYISQESVHPIIYLFGHRGCDFVYSARFSSNSIVILIREL